MVAIPAPEIAHVAAAARAGSAKKSESRSLNFYYGAFQALKNINMPIYEKQVTALIGPSGCGKSTFLRCFNRMHDLYPGNRYEGEIMLYPDNTNILEPGRRPDRGAHAHQHGVPEAQPVPQVDLRERGLRPARARRAQARAARREGRGGAARTRRCGTR